MSKYSENIPDDIKAAIGWMYDYIEEGKTFLDFGCSTGYFGGYIKNQKKCRVVGVEISDDKKEASKVLDKVMSFDIDANWPKELAEEKYDYIFYGDVIEHLKDPSAALKKSAELLNEGGMIFVSTPNVAHISVRLELLEGNFEYEPMGILDSTHLKYFTRKSLTKVVKDAGLFIIDEGMSTNDIPIQIISDKINQLGLKAEKKFWEVVKSPEARAYQYKLVLSKTKTSSKNRVDNLSNKPLQYRDDYIKMLKKESQKLLKHANKQAEIIKDLVSRLEEVKASNDTLVDELTKIKSSKVWKIRNRLKIWK
jgi:2-polyprenyl-3-methyl-5-hydroxy-6-metoxy-1,4-benzoquinol methylase